MMARFGSNLDWKSNGKPASSVCEVVCVCVTVQGYCSKHSKKLEPDGTPRKVTSSTPKKHSEMTEEEKKAAKARK